MKFKRVVAYAVSAVVLFYSGWIAAFLTAQYALKGFAKRKGV